MKQKQGKRPLFLCTWKGNYSRCNKKEGETERQGMKEGQGMGRDKSSEQR